MEQSGCARRCAWHRPHRNDQEKKGRALSGLGLCCGLHLILGYPLFNGILLSLNGTRIGSDQACVARDGVGDTRVSHLCERAGVPAGPGRHVRPWAEQRLQGQGGTGASHPLGMEGGAPGVWGSLR